MNDTGESLSRPSKASYQFRRVAILFAGGPAPGANAVISTAAISFLRNNCEVVGMKHGYSSLAEYSTTNPLVEGRDFVWVTPAFLKRSRSSQGILLGTARTNPGRLIAAPEHFDDPVKVAQEGLRQLRARSLEPRLRQIELALANGPSDIDSDPISLLKERSEIQRQLRQPLILAAAV